MKVRVPLLLVLVGAVLGLVLSSISTYDFASHLDRQVHALHCGWIPGVGAPDATGTSGCHVALMSPYSSVLRASFWGGIPISLPAMCTFTLLGFWTVFMMVTRRSRDRRATLLLLLMALLPLGASLVMGTISAVKLGTFCKVCVGIYTSSILIFVGALGAFRRARQPLEGAAADATVPEGEYVEPLTAQQFGMGAGAGVLFHVVPLVAYLAAMPNYDQSIGQCGTLRQPADPGGLFVSLGGPATGPKVTEILDPLCPSCKAFEERLMLSGLGEQVQRSAVLFPLDSTCNWMVAESLHPGACAVSEAVLCAGPRANAVIEWAFSEQENIINATKANAGAAARMARERFPELASCIGTPTVRQKLNRSLRWAVANQLPVITPQLYVEGKKLCDEDTDLGMEYALTRMLSQQGGGH